MSLAGLKMRCVVAVFLICAGLAQAADPAKPVNFEQHVAPIFKRHCVQCHGESKQKAGLDLSSFASVSKGGTGGAVVVAGRSSASRIVEVISASDPAERMPPENDAIPNDQIATIRAWIDGGLRQNAGSTVAPPEANAMTFTPAANATKLDGPPPMPEHLPAIGRAKTMRPFPVLALASSPRAPLVAAASFECIDFVDPASRNIVGTIAFPQGEPHVLRFSRSGRILLAAGGRPVQSGAAVLFDVTSGKHLAEFGDETDAVLAADLSPDERKVALGGSGRVVKLYSTEKGKLEHTLIKHTDWITSVAFSPDGKLLATGDRIGNIHLWDAQSGGVVLPLAEHKGAIRSLTWRSDSHVLASCGEDGLIVWWDVAKGWPATSRADAHPPARPEGYYGKIANGVLDASFGPTGELVTCGRDQAVRVWSNDGRELHRFSIANGSTTGIKVFPTRVAMSFDGTTVIAGDSAGRLHSWQVKKPGKSK